MPPKVTNTSLLELSLTQAQQIDNEEELIQSDEHELMENGEDVFTD